MPRSQLCKTQRLWDPRQDKKSANRKFLSVDDGQPEIRPNEEIGSMKGARRNTNRCERIFASRDDAADNVSCSSERGVPEIVAQHSAWIRVTPMFIGCMKG
jgi:hypothetical protein